MSAPFLNICRLQECLSAVNAAHALDCQYQLTLSMVVAPLLDGANGSAGARSGSNDHLAVDLYRIDNLEWNDLANFGICGTHRFDQSQFNVRRVTTGLRRCCQYSVAVLIASSELRKRNVRKREN
jgi:hypothetical protein